MPIPAIPPAAAMLLRLGAVAAVAYVATRRTNRGMKDVVKEQALDDLDEGIAVSRHENGEGGTFLGSGRLKRTIRMTPFSPGFEFDLSAMARLRLRKVS